MSKKKARQMKKAGALRRSKRSPRQVIIILCLLLALGMVGGIFAQWRAGRIRSLLSPAPTPTAPGSPSKEYIYAGGRLIATEEPAGGGSSSLSAPSNLAATGTSTPAVNLTWNASTGGTLDHYQLERCQNITVVPNCYSYVVNVTANTPTINYSDTSVSAGTAYLYRVRAVDSSGNFSNYSGVDLATTIFFTDDPLSAGVTIVKAQHLAEIRQAVNAVRTLAGLSSSAWTDTSLTGVAIKAVHIQELRTSLDQALTAINISSAPYTDSTLSSTITVKAVHLQEIRNRVK